MKFQKILNFHKFTIILSLLWIRAIGFCHFVDILENSASQFFSKLQVGNPGSEPADCLWSRPAHAVLAVSSPPLSLYIPTYLVFLTCECLCLGKNLLCQVDRRYMVDFSKFIVSNNILAIHALLLPYVRVRIANMQKPRLVLDPRNEKKNIYFTKIWFFFLSNF